MRKLAHRGLTDDPKTCLWIALRFASLRGCCFSARCCSPRVGSMARRLLWAHRLLVSGRACRRRRGHAHARCICAAWLRRRKETSADQRCRQKLRAVALASCDGHTVPAGCCGAREGGWLRVLQTDSTHGVARCVRIIISPSPAHPPAHPPVPSPVRSQQSFSLMKS